MASGQVTMVEEEPASPATRLFHSPRLNCFIIAIIGCKVKVDVEVVKKGGFNTLFNIPRFSSVMVKDEKRGMRWIPKTVTLEDQLFCPDVDYDINSADEFVEHYIAGLTAKPMDLTKPLWELHILNVKTSDANALAIFRIHHSLGDGISLISALIACLRKTSDPESLPSIPSKKPKDANRPSPIRRCFYAIWAMFMMIINTLLDVTLFSATILFLKDTETPIKGGPGVERTQKRIMHRTVSLDDIKLVKTAMNATINDVILGVTGAGLSRYLNRIYEISEKGHKASEKTNSLPKNIRFRASQIFNIRSSAGLQVIADMTKRKSKAKWGNQIGYSLLPLRIALHDDPLIYFREAQRMGNRKKLSLESRFSYAAVKYLLKLLGEKVAVALTYKVLFNTTICLSNVVGPQEEVSIDGHPISYIAPSVHGLPHALTIHYQSCADKMTIVLTYDPSVILDPHQLCDDLEESLNVIKNVVVRRGLVKDVNP